MNEGRRGKVHDGVITRSSTDAQCLSSPVCHHVDLFSKCRAKVMKIMKHADLNSNIPTESSL